MQQRGPIKQECNSRIFELTSHMVAITERGCNLQLRLVGDMQSTRAAFEAQATQNKVQSR